MELKVCVECREVFVPNHHTQIVCSSECRQIRRSRLVTCIPQEKKQQQWSKAHQRRRFKSYGITESIFLHMLTQQASGCAICGGSLEQKACIDHCHTTGIVRGILCDNCNKALGLFKDNPNVLRKATVYLESGITACQKDTTVRQLVTDNDNKV